LKKPKPALNRIVYAPLRGGFRKNPVGASAFVGFYSTTFLRLLEHFVFLYRNRNNVAYNRNVKRNTPVFCFGYCGY
jgi:hypothetical protein